MSKTAKIFFALLALYLAAHCFLWYGRSCKSAALAEANETMKDERQSKFFFRVHESGGVALVYRHRPLQEARAQAARAGK